MVARVLLVILYFISACFFALLTLSSSFGFQKLHSFTPIPPDNFGWSELERTQYVSDSVAVFSVFESKAGVQNKLTNLRQESGAILYTGDEVSHLVDVKVRLDLVWLVGSAAAGAVLMYVLLLWRTQQHEELHSFLQLSAVFTVSLFILFTVAVLATWSRVFTVFHELIFPQGNWSFIAERSLIRLFPEQFWFAFAISWGALSLVYALVPYGMSVAVRSMQRTQARSQLST